MIGAEKFLEALVKNGVDTIFGYPGGANMPLYDKLPNFPKLKHILVRNEQGAAFAAQGYARTKKKLGVCFGTSGPGASNLITGVMDAMMDSIPLLVVTGQVPLAVMGSDAFQELDTIGTFMSITKHSFIVDSADKVEAIVDEAIKIATSGRPGPVLIDFPKDVSLAEVKENKKLEKPLYYSNIASLDVPNEKIENFFDILYSSKKPVLLVGQGVKFANAEKQINELINKLQIPTVSTLLAKGVVREDNPNYLGMIGMHGTYKGNLAAYNADLVINIGSRFDDRLVGTYDSFIENGKKIVHVDIDIAELDKLIKTDLKIHANAKDFLDKVLENDIKKLEIDDWKKEIETFKKDCEEVDNFSIKKALTKLNSFTEKKLDDYIFVTDVGQHQMWSSMLLKVASTTSWLSSGGAGTMGFSLPVSVGAAIANPEKTVINIAGDGSIQMNIQELQVLKDYNLNVKVIVLNNSFLGMVRQWQDLFFDKNYSGTPISAPDFVKLADAYGIKGYSVSNEKELENILEKELENKGPAIIEMKVESEENIYPMVPPGFTLKDTITCKVDLVKYENLF